MVEEEGAGTWKWRAGGGVEVCAWISGHADDVCPHAQVDGMAVGAMRMIGVVGVVIACLALRCAAQLDDAEACTEPYAIRLQRNLTLEQSSNAACFLLNVRCGDVGLGNLTEANILAGDRAESTFTCFGCTSGAHVVIRYRAPTDNERLVAIAILTGLSVLAGT